MEESFKCSGIAVRPSTAYDGRLGRFPAVDAFAVNYAPATPFQYAANNPIRYIDYTSVTLTVRPSSVPKSPSLISPPLNAARIARGHAIHDI
jgi:hypothetical protein